MAEIIDNGWLAIETFDVNGAARLVEGRSPTSSAAPPPISVLRTNARLLRFNMSLVSTIGSRPRARGGSGVVR